MPETHLQSYIINSLARQGVEATPEQADELVRVVRTASLLRTGGNLDDLLVGLARANQKPLSHLYTPSRWLRFCRWLACLYWGAQDWFWGSEVL